MQMDKRNHDALTESVSLTRLSQINPEMPCRAPMKEVLAKNNENSLSSSSFSMQD